MHNLNLSNGLHEASAHLALEHELIAVLKREVESLNHLIAYFPSSAVELLKKLMITTGKVIFTGNGKSGSIARKLAATFSSLGTPSFFMHPSDALHGDLGMVAPHDCVIMLSKSGSGFEFDHIIRYCSSQSIGNVLLCCDEGPLTKKAELVVRLPLQQEACYMNLAPSSSSTLMVAFGDAVAIVLSKLKGFTKYNFAHVHPGGTLGKKLLLTVNTLMHSGNALPLLSAHTLFQDLILIVTSKKLGTGIVVDDKQQLLGIITDGDLRRACSKGSSVFNQTAHDIMTRNPKVASTTMLAYDALLMMETHTISSLVVLEEQKVVGLLHIHDLVKSGLKG